MQLPGLILVTAPPLIPTVTSAITKMPPPTPLSTLWAPLHMVILTTPTSDFPFTMSTNWTAISSPQRLWASLVLAPKWGQLMTFSWSTRARLCGGSCQKEIPLSWLPWSAPGCEGNWRGGWQDRCHLFYFYFVRVTIGLSHQLPHECPFTTAEWTELWTRS